MDTMASPLHGRSRFGPSRATGLVFTQENQYLGDYFKCMDFLQLTSQRCAQCLRRAIVVRQP